MPHLRARILVIVGAIASVLLIGTVGFVVIEDYSWFDAFYMALTTVSTVGYGEIRHLHTAGRIFNSFLILVGVTAIFLGVGAMTQTIIELELTGYFPKRRMKRMIEKLKDHYIVCGYGRVGRAAVTELQRAEVPFIVLDRNEAKVERAIHTGVIATLGDSTLDEHLRAVGISRAKGLIAALATDADNLFLVISAKTLNPMLNVASRVIEEEAEPKFRRAGADAVFMPYNMAGSRLAQSILRPHVVEFLEVATAESEMKVSIEQVKVGGGSEFVDKSIRQLQLRKQVGVIVLAVRKQDGQMVFNPDPDTLIQSGDYLIAMGSDSQLRDLTALVAEATV